MILLSFVCCLILRLILCVLFVVYTDIMWFEFECCEIPNFFQFTESEIDLFCIELCKKLPHILPFEEFLFEVISC